MAGPGSSHPSIPPDRSARFLRAAATAARPLASLSRKVQLGDIFLMVFSPFPIILEEIHVFFGCLPGNFFVWASFLTPAGLKFLSFAYNSFRNCLIVRLSRSTCASAARSCVHFSTNEASAGGCSKRPRPPLARLHRSHRSLVLLAERVPGRRFLRCTKPPTQPSSSSTSSAVLRALLQPVGVDALRTGCSASSRLRLSSATSSQSRFSLC